MMDIYLLPELYDEQYRHYRDDLRFYRRLAEDYGGPVLELGAGSGRVTVALAQAGHRVVGLEISSAMLAAARRRVAEAGVEHLVDLVEGDMRDFDLGRRFPLVIAPFNALMHLHAVSEQDAALRAAVAHLEEGGLFACDLFVPRFEGLGSLRRVAEWSHVGGQGSDLFLLQEHDPVQQSITSHYLVDTLGADGTVHRRRVTLRQRYWYRFELERALAQAGLTRTRAFGDFERGPVTADSRHLVIQARPGTADTGSR